MALDVRKVVEIFTVKIITRKTNVFVLGFTKTLIYTCLKYLFSILKYMNFKSLGWTGFFEVVMFVGFFLVGFIYILKKGALKWED
jgi:hypothetical protein